MASPSNRSWSAKSAAASLAARAGLVAAFVLKLPIHAYRWSFKAFFGWHCRHLPTCSEYALEAIDRNGAWRGFWLMLSRLSRCRPMGTSGYDPVPDIRQTWHPLAPWRYGIWSRRTPPPGDGAAADECCSGND